MGLLDDLGGALGAVTGGQAGGQAGGLAGLVGGLLQGGVGAQGGQLVSALLGGGDMGKTLETLTANGLSEQVASWVSQNPNLPVSPDQIRAALGSEQVEQMASAVGLPVGDFLKHLAEHLPAAAAAAASNS